MRTAVAAALLLHAHAFAAAEIRLTSGLGLAAAAPRAASRTMARIDPVELAIVRGQWQEPRAGQSFAGGTWTEIKAG